MENYKNNLEGTFKCIKLKEDEIASTLNVTSIKNNRTNEIRVFQYVNGNKIDLVESITFLLRNEKELDIQSIFEAVKERV